MRVFGITTVRNAASTIRISVLPLDNGSTDATPSILRRLQRRYHVSVTRDGMRRNRAVTGTASAPGL